MILSTGLVNLDEKLPWSGLPKGGLSAFVGAPGSGNVRLWASTLAKLHQTSPESMGAWLGDLYPPGFAQLGVDLRRLLLVNAPEDRKSWVLSQIVRTRIFHIVGSYLSVCPRTVDLQKLANEARACGTSVVLFFNQEPAQLPHWLFKLKIHFDEPEFFKIQKAHCALPAPLLVRRSNEHANSLSENIRQLFELRNCG